MPVRHIITICTSVGKSFLDCYNLLLFVFLDLNVDSQLTILAIHLLMGPSSHDLKCSGDSIKNSFRHDLGPYLHVRWLTGHDHITLTPFHVSFFIRGNRMYCAISTRPGYQ